MKLKFFLISCTLLLTNCTGENEDVTNQIEKDGSVEVELKCEHVGTSYDVLTTCERVWYFKTSLKLKYSEENFM